MIINSNLKVDNKQIRCIGCAVSGTVIYAPVVFPTRINGITNYQLHNNQANVTNVGDMLPATIITIDDDSCVVSITFNAGTLTIGNAYECEFVLSAY